MFGSEAFGFALGLVVLVTVVAVADFLCAAIVFFIGMFVVSSSYYVSGFAATNYDSLTDILSGYFSDYLSFF